jgi:hypothetical protein
MSLNSDEPDIIITDEDLQQFDQQSKRIREFFSNPTPSPMAPVAIVEGICNKTRRKFAVLFEQSTKRDWKLVKFIDDSLSLEGQTPMGVSVQKELIKGNIDWSLLNQQLISCPYCKSTYVAKCGSCNRLSCHPDGQQGSQFHCPWCGSTSTLSGYIQTLDGSNRKGKKI